jgi:hypothetical protein
MLRRRLSTAQLLTARTRRGRYLTVNHPARGSHAPARAPGAAGWARTTLLSSTPAGVPPDHGCMSLPRPGGCAPSAGIANDLETTVRYGMTAPSLRHPVIGMTGSAAVPGRTQISLICDRHR